MASRRVSSACRRGIFSKARTPPTATACCRRRWRRDHRDALVQVVRAGPGRAGAFRLRCRARRDGPAWTTDKDGLIAALLSAVITAKMGRDPGVLYADLASKFGNPVAERAGAPAGPAQKARLATMTPQRVTSTELAGEKIERLLSQAPGNAAQIGGIKVSAASRWFGARPSGTEDIYKIHAESFAGQQHLQRELDEAQAIVDAAISTASGSGEG